MGTREKTAREKLNGCYGWAAVLAAGLIGLASGSALAFAAALAALLALALAAGAIRPGGRAGPPNPPRRRTRR